MAIPVIDDDDGGADLLDHDLNWRDIELPDEAHIDYTPVELGIDDALGPETHDYGSMAVHLYMKKTGEIVSVD
jgi:hypothetical protein